MREFLTDIHSLESGVRFTLRWKDEREYQLGKAFLKELLGDASQVGANDSDRIPTYYFESDRLVDALHEFRRKLGELKIICYMAWCGADAEYQFDSKEEYDAARVFLDNLSAARLGANELPMVFPNSGTYFYVIDTEDREAFQSFMRSRAREAD